MALTAEETTTINNNVNILKTCRKYDFYGDLELALTPGNNLSRMGAFWDYVTLFDSSLGPSLDSCITAMNNTYTLFDGETLITRIREHSSEILSITKPPSYYYVIYKYCLNFPVYQYIFEADIFYLFRLYHMASKGYKLLYANPLNSPPETYVDLELSDPDYRNYCEVPVSDLKEKYLTTLTFLEDCPPSTFRPTLVGNDEFSRLIGLAYNHIRAIEKTGDNNWFRNINVGKKYEVTDTDFTHPGVLASFIISLPEPDKTKCYCMARVLNTYFLTYSRSPLVRLTSRYWSYIQNYHKIDDVNNYSALEGYIDHTTLQVQTNYSLLNQFDEIYPNCPETVYGDPMQFEDFDGYFLGDVEGTREEETLSFKLYNDNSSIQDIFNLTLPLQEVRALLHEEVKRLHPEKISEWFPYQNGRNFPYLNYYMFKFNSILTGEFEPLSMADGIYYLHYFYQPIYHNRYSNKFNAFFTKRKRYYVDEPIYFDLERRDLVKKIDTITDPFLTEDIKNYVKQIDTEEFMFLIYFGRQNSTYQTALSSPDGTEHSFPIPLSLTEFNNMVNSNQLIKDYILGNIYSYSNETEYFNSLLELLEDSDNDTYLKVRDCLPLFKLRIGELIDLYYASYINVDLYAKDKTENFYMLFSPETNPSEETFAIKGKAFFKVPEYTNQTVHGAYYDLASKVIRVVDGTIPPKPLNIGDFSKYSFYTVANEDFLLIPTNYNTSLFQKCDYITQFEIPPVDYLKYAVKIVKVNKGVKEDYIKPFKNISYKVVQNDVVLKAKNNRATYIYTP